MPTLTQKLKALEARVLALESNQVLKGFVKMSDAEDLLGISRKTILRRIDNALVNPQTSVYKEGIHFKRLKNGHYRINVEKWHEAE